MFKKELTIISAYWQRNLVYRSTIVAYRIGEIVEQMALVVLWLAIYDNTPLVSGYTINEMITYVIVGNFFNVLSRNFIARLVALDIKEGKLSAHLLRPFSYLKFMFLRTVGGHSLAAMLSALSEVVILILFYTKIQFNFDPAYLLLIVAMIAFAIITEFLLGFFIGMIAFWTDEVDGILDTILSLRKFFSGGFFPLSLLPALLASISYALPFAYTFFVPMQLFLKKISITVGLRGLAVQIVWMIILYGLIKFFWKRGLKKYEGVGI